MRRPSLRLLSFSLLLASGAWAQQSRPFVPSPPSAAAREGLRLYQQGCQAEDYDDATCAKAEHQLDAAVHEDPHQLEAQLALAEAVWNQSLRKPENSPERTQLRQRALGLYQQLVDQNVPDARPYYQLSLLTRDPATRARLLRRAVELDPKHPEAHKDLASVLLEQGQTDEAMREYRTHLTVKPLEGRAEALERLHFADKLAKLGRVREAAEVYDAVWASTSGQSRAERCQLFQSVDLDPYERMGARFAQRVRELRTACSGKADTQSLEHAQELERQGRADAAVQELERQVQRNPKPAEPYLAMERLYRKQGKVAEAARTVTRYFQQEQDPTERCRHFRTLSPQTAKALDPALLGELERACRPPRP